MSEELHELPAVQQRLKISRTKVFNLLRSGDLQAVRIGRRTLVPDSAIDAYIERLKADGDTRPTARPIHPPLTQLQEHRDEAGRQWEAAFQRSDLAGMDAAMREIRALSRQIAGWGDVTE